ncbi:MAG: tripartite tricarboxylate transporter substrate binding protein [Paucimonas sp.]|nr:tripartite tricarboxylate transporter substrate binding protein [Paucimonas sp.]
MNPTSRLVCKLLNATVLLLASLGSSLALAADYPSKPIRMLLGYPPGSGIDNVARQVAQRMEKSLGQPVVVDNRPGALGNIAAQAVATSAPDGYTILFTPNSAMGINVHLFKQMPFDPVKDFLPVAPVATLGFAILVNPETVPVKNLQELTAMIKKEPGKYSYGTGNATGQVVGALYASMAGLQAQNIPYKGVPPAMTDLLGGRIQYVIADASLAIPQVKGGRVKALAVTNKTRVPALKDVPTMQEAGLPGYDLTAWFGIFLPAKAPTEAAQSLSTHIRQAVSDPALVASLRAIGVEAMPGSPADLAKMMASDTEKWGRIIREAHITVTD